eukprot:3008068-Amphidinium_carterae.1
MDCICFRDFRQGKGVQTERLDSLVRCTQGTQNTAPLAYNFTQPEVISFNRKSCSKLACFTWSSISAFGQSMLFRFGDSMGFCSIAVQYVSESNVCPKLDCRRLGLVFNLDYYEMLWKGGDG